MGNSTRKYLLLSCLFFMGGSTALAQITSSQAGPWNSGSTWVGGQVPDVGDEVIIKHDVTIAAAVTRKARTTVSGRLILMAGFRNADSTIIVGTLEIKAGGSIPDGTAPLYSNKSLLRYNHGNTFVMATEWMPHSNPYDVEIIGSTSLNYPSKLQNARSVRGALLIGSGSGLNMDNGASFTSGALSVEKNLTMSGVLRLGHHPNEDLKLRGDLVLQIGYNLQSNNRRVVFERSTGIQQIQTPGNAALQLDYVVCGGSEASFNGHEVKLNQNLTVLAPLEGTAIDIDSDGSINLNGYNLTVGQSGKNSTMNGKLKGHSSSNVEFKGTGAAGNLGFKAGFQQLAGIILSRNLDETVILTTPLTLYGESQFNGGVLNIGDHDLTFKTGSSYTGGSANSYICVQDGGMVLKEFTKDHRDFIFPVGDLAKPNPEYSPATVSLFQATGTIKVGVNLRNVRHPNNSISSHYLSRYWNVSVENPGNVLYKASATFNYTSADVTGSEAQLRTAGYFDGNWYLYNKANTADHTLSVSSVENLIGAYTGGDDFKPLASAPSSHFRSKTSSDWPLRTTWEASPDSILWMAATAAPTGAASSIVIQKGHTVDINSEVHQANTIVLGRLRLRSGGIINVHTAVTHGFSIREGGIFEVATNATYASSIKLPAEASIAIQYFGVDSAGTVIIDKPLSGTAGTGFENLATSHQNRWANRSRFVWNNGLAFPTSEVIYFPQSSVGTAPVFSVGPEPIPEITSAGTLTINGIFDVRTNVNFTGVTGVRNFRDGITGNSTLKIARGPGKQKITGADAILGGAGLTLDLGKTLYLDSSVIVPQDSSVILLTRGLDNNVAGNILDIQGTLDIADTLISNANGTINIAQTGVFRSSNPGNTIWPLISVPSGAVNLAEGATIEFYREGDQTFKRRDDFSNLIFSGSGIKTPSSGFRYMGAITIQDEAIFDAGNKAVGDTTFCNLVMTGGRYRTTSAGPNPTIKGTYNLTGGVVEFARSDLATFQSIRKEEFFNIDVSGDKVRNGDGNLDIREGGSFTIKPRGVFVINANSIKAVKPGEATVILESGSTMKVGNERGFHAHDSTDFGDPKLSAINHNIPVSKIILEPGSTIDYYRDTADLSGTGAQTITTKDGLEYQNLVISGRGVKSVSSAGDLLIKGNFKREGAAVFGHNAGKVIFKGDIPQQLDAGGSVFYDLRNENQDQLQINAEMSIKNSLDLADGSKLRLSKGDVTLSSDLYRTALVLPVLHDNAISYASHPDSGRFRVERHIPEHPKAWQLLSASSKGGTFRESWQNNQDNSPGRGVWMTKPGGGGGFDAASAAPSVKYYNPSTNDFVGVSSTSNILSSHPAYFLFVRGDRMVRGISQPATATTLHTRGKLFVPGIDAPPSVTVQPEQFEMLGNPYASPIEFKDLNFSDQPASYHIWDPRLTTLAADGGTSEYGLGGYRAITYDDLTGERIATPPLPDSAEPAPIQSGQGFFVFNESSTPMEISFTEAAKINEDVNIFRTKQTMQGGMSRIAANLYIHSAGSKTLMDGALQLFDDDFSPAVDNSDAKKIMNATENIAIPSYKYPLIVERRPYPAEGDTLFYHLTRLGRKNYSLQISLSEGDAPRNEVYLNDAHLQTQTLLHSGNNSFDFVVNSDPASAKKDRFYLTFKKIIPPFQFVQQNATAGEGKVTVSWKVANQHAILAYVLEHGRDGHSFVAIHQQTVAANDAVVYDALHEEPEQGKHYYRVKAVMKDGGISYSDMMSVQIAYRAAGISAYPNPVKDVLQLDFYRQAEGKYRLELISPDGRRVMMQKVHHTGFRNVHKLSLPVLSAGVYQLKITKPDGSSWQERVVVR